MWRLGRFTAVGHGDRGGGEADAGAVQLAAELGQVLVAPGLVAGDREVVADVEVVDGELELVMQEKVPARAVQLTLQGPRNSSNALEFRAPNPAKQLIGPSEMTAPQYTDEEERGVFTPNGAYFGWDCCYELEIWQGRLWVRRKIDFNARRGSGGLPGFGPSPAAWRMWKREIESVWDHRFYLHRVGCERGRDCDCGLRGCCKFPIRVLALRGPGHGKPVDLFAGAPKAENWGVPDRWWYSHTWWHGIGEAPNAVRAHEFGHLVGNYDEYPEGACHPSRAWSRAPGSIMNDGTRVHPRHFQHFIDWFKPRLSGVVGDCNLVKIG